MIRLVPDNYGWNSGIHGISVSTLFFLYFTEHVEQLQYIPIERLTPACFSHLSVFSKNAYNLLYFNCNMFYHFYVLF